MLCADVLSFFELSAEDRHVPTSWDFYCRPHKRSVPGPQSGTPRPLSRQSQAPPEGEQSDAWGGGGGCDEDRVQTDSESDE